MIREPSLTEAAVQLQISKSLMRYWVKAMLKRDSIGAVWVEKRGPHLVPIYEKYDGRDQPGAGAKSYLIRYLLVEARSE
jgi:hypothetical protein